MSSRGWRPAPATAGVLLAALLGVPAVAGAEPTATPDPSTDAYRPKAWARAGTRLINLATPQTVGHRRWELAFLHRFVGTVQEGSGHDLWGLDTGADVTLAVGYGLSRHWDLAIARASLQETFELAVKRVLWQQADGAPADIGVRFGGDVVARPGIEDATRPFLQVLLGRRLSPRWEFFAAPSWVADTPRLRNAVNLPLGVAWNATPSTRLEVELVPRNRSVEGSPIAWHVAVARAVGGHLFKVTAGNSRATTVDQMLGSDAIGSFQDEDVRLGFNLVRYLPR